MKRVALLTIAVVITSCATARDVRQTMFPPTTALVGKTVADLYKTRGVPDVVLDDPACAGCKLHIYVSHDSFTAQDVSHEEFTPNLSGGGMKSTTVPGATHTYTSTSKSVFHADAAGVITAVTTK